MATAKPATNGPKTPEIVTHQNRRRKSSSAKTDPTPIRPRGPSKPMEASSPPSGSSRAMEARSPSSGASGGSEVPSDDATSIFVADGIDDGELEDRVIGLEKKVSQQEDEILCLKSALADALRRLSAIETQNHRILPNTPGQSGKGKIMSSGIQPMRTNFAAATPTPVGKANRASTPGAVDNRAASRNGRRTPDVSAKGARPPSPATSMKGSTRMLHGATSSLEIDTSPQKPVNSHGSLKAHESAMARRERPLSTSSTLDTAEGVIRLTIRGRNIPLYIPTEHIPDYANCDINPAPKEQLKLDWVYGYRGRDSRSNLFLLPTGELIYPIAGVVVLYNVEEQMQRHYLAHTDDVKSLAVHPDKITIASGQVAGHDRKTARPHIRVWDSVSLNTLKVVGISGEFTNAVSCLSFSVADGGKHLAAIDESNDHVLSLWEWEKGEHGKKIHETKSSADPVLAVEFHPTERNILVSCGKYHLSFWTLEGGLLTKKQGLFERFDKPKYVLCLSFTPEGDVVTGDSNGNVLFWSRSKQKVTSAITAAHDGGIFSLVQKTDGTVITGGGKDRRLVQWHFETSSGLYEKIAEAELDEAFGPARCLAMGKGNTVVVGTTKNCVLQGGLDIGFSPIVRGHVDELWGLAVSPKQHQFVSAAHDKQVNMWDTMSHSVIWSAEVPDPAQSAAFHPSGDKIAVGLTSGKWVVIDANTREIVFRQMDGNEQHDAIAFSPDGKFIAVGSHDNYIYVHEMNDDGTTFSRVGRCSGHSSFVTHLDWSENSEYIRSNSGDLEALFWNPATCKQVTHAASLRDVPWATDTCTLSYGTCGIWQEGADGTDVNGCCRSSGKKLLAAGDDFGKVSLFSFPCNRLRSESRLYGGHSSHVTNLRFLFDDSRLLSAGGKDTAILQWAIV